LNESAPEEKEAPGCPPPPLLKILEDILHNRIKKKKTEMQKTQNRANITDRVWTEIETLQKFFLFLFKPLVICVCEIKFVLVAAGLVYSSSSSKS
jgi:ABC-type transport system involved in cytochrome bd biosynthesis fused ATPase/permease subunit